MPEFKDSAKIPPYSVVRRIMAKKFGEIELSARPNQIKVDKSGQQAPITTIYDVDSISTLQRIGPQFGVEVDILNKAGEEYINSSSLNPISHEPMVCKRLVPQGKAYIQISSPEWHKDFSNFWKAVSAEEAAQKNSSNPPKI